MNANAGRRPLVAAGAVALLVGVGAAPLLAKSGSGSTSRVSPTDVSRNVAKRYLAAITASRPTALAPLFARNAVEVDKVANGPPIQGVESIVSGWTEALKNTAGVHYRGAVTCAAPAWAVVNFTARAPSALYAGGTMKVSGVSVLDIKGGVITRETIYYERVDTR